MYGMYYYIPTAWPLETTCSLESCKICTVKPVLSSHSKIDKAKILMTNGRLMKVESIAECSPFDLHQAIIGLQNQILFVLRVAILDRFY